MTISRDLNLPHLRFVFFRQPTRQGKRPGVRCADLRIWFLKKPHHHSHPQVRHIRQMECWKRHEMPNEHCVSTASLSTFTQSGPRLPRGQPVRHRSSVVQGRGHGICNVPNTTLRSHIVVCPRYSHDSPLLHRWKTSKGLHFSWHARESCRDNIPLTAEHLCP